METKITPKMVPKKSPKRLGLGHTCFCFQRRWLEGAWHRNSTCLAIWSLGTLLGIVGETRCFVFCWWLTEVTSRLQKMKSHRIYCMFHFLVYLCATSYQDIWLAIKKIKKTRTMWSAACLMFVGYFLYLFVLFEGHLYIRIYICNYIYIYCRLKGWFGFRLISNWPCCSEIRQVLGNIHLKHITIIILDTLTSHVSSLCHKMP